MTTELYILPIVTQNNGRAPKYLPARLNPGGTLSGMEGATWALHDYVLEQVAVVAVAATQEQHDLLASQSDVIQIPPLDNTIGAAGVTKVKNFLESVNCPAGWVQTGQTYRFILRTILHIFFFYNRVAGDLGTSLFGGGVTLNTTLGQLSQNMRDRIAAAATELGLSTAGATGSTTIRAVLKSVAQQLDDQPVVIGGGTVTDTVTI